MADTELLALAAEIVAAHVSNNSTAASELPGLIRSVHEALSSTTNPPAPEPEKREPAVPIRSSVKQDYIVCLEDGAKLKMLKRYLRTRYDMTPEQYREKWGLPRDYPMVAPAYAEQRRGLAHSIGLGRKKPVEEETIEAAPKTPRKRGDNATTAEGEPEKPRGRPRKAKTSAAEASAD